MHEVETMGIGPIAWPVRPWEQPSFFSKHAQYLDFFNLLSTVTKSDTPFLCSLNRNGEGFCGNMQNFHVCLWFSIRKKKKQEKLRQWLDLFFSHLIAVVWVSLNVTDYKSDYIVKNKYFLTFRVLCLLLGMLSIRNWFWWQRNQYWLRGHCISWTKCKLIFWLF